MQLDAVGGRGIIIMSTREWLFFIYASSSPFHLWEIIDLIPFPYLFTYSTGLCCPAAACVLLIGNWQSAAVVNR